MSDEIDLTAPEVQDAIKAAVDKAVAPLVAKRDELLGEVRKLRKGREIDPAEMEKLEEQVENLKVQLAEATKAAKKAAKDAEDATKAREAAEGGMATLLVDNGLSEALAKASVTHPVHQKAAKALLRDQVQLVTEGDKRVAKVGDKALADFITEWAGSDEGKHFVTAPDVTGDGARGSRKASPDRNPFAKGEHFNLTEQARISRENPALAAQLKQAATR